MTALSYGIRAKVFKRGRLWHCVVQQGDRVLLADNCSTYGPMADEALEAVAAFRRVAHAGQKFKSWRKLLDEAGGR